MPGTPPLSKSATAKSFCDRALNKLEPADLDGVAASLGRAFVAHGHYLSRATERRGYSETDALFSDFYLALSRLHNFAGENIELTVVLFAHLSDLKRARLVTAYDRTLCRWRVARRKLDNDAGR